MDYLHVKASETLSLKVEAEEKVRLNEKIEIALKAILEGASSDFIAKITGLSLKEIEKLRSKK